MARDATFFFSCFLAIFGSPVLFLSVLLNVCIFAEIYSK